MVRRLRADRQGCGCSAVVVPRAARTMIGGKGGEGGGGSCRSPVHLAVPPPACLSDGRGGGAPLFPGAVGDEVRSGRRPPNARGGLNGETTSTSLSRKAARMTGVRQPLR